MHKMHELQLGAAIMVEKSMERIGNLQFPKRNNSLSRKAKFETFWHVPNHCGNKEKDSNNQVVVVMVVVLARAENNNSPRPPL